MVREVAPGDALLRLFEQSDDARALTEPDGTIVLANRSLQDLLGWAPEELAGGSSQVVVPPAMREEYTRLRGLVVAADSTDTVRMNLRAVHRDGHEVPVRLTARLIHLGSHRLLSYVFQPRQDEELETGFREVLEALLDGNVIVDGEGRIVMVNQRVEELFGYREVELLDQSVEILVPENLRAVHADHRAGFTGLARRHPMGQGRRVLGRRSDGTTFPIQVLLSSVGAGEGVLVSATIHDLSEVEELQSQNDRLRSQFLATVSHELRTPLTTIMASAEMLVDDLDEDDGPISRDRVEAYLDRIMRAARRELALVDDILALTAIDGSEEHGRTGLADLSAAALSAVAHRRDDAATHHLTVETRVPDARVFVSAHDQWLARAIGCLLDNALKFTPPGGRVSVTVAVDGDAVLEVLDTGPGIPPGEEEMVFERLSRGSNALAAETPGAGLGLTIARSIAVAAGGSLVAVPGQEGGFLRMTLPVPPSTFRDEVRLS